MPGAGRAEVYFISAMMLLIVSLCIAAVIIFFKTYKKEMRAKAERERISQAEQAVVEKQNAAP
jgi:flagellar basal body-associated protein FliL